MKTQRNTHHHKGGNNSDNDSGIQKSKELKHIEVHNDGHYHNSLKQYLYWERNVITGEPLPEPVKNITGDRRLHRWRKANLKELLEDYEPVTA